MTIHKATRVFISFLLAFLISNQVFAVPEKISKSSRAVFEANASNAVPESRSLPKVETYDELVHAIRGVQAESQKRIERAIENVQMPAQKITFCF